VAATLLATLLLAACGRAPPHPGWVIHFTVEIAGPPPPGGYRLVFPYIVGDLYGSPNTGAFVEPARRPSGRFVLDLNRTQEILERELEPTDFALGFLRVTPAQTRIARLTPIALERDGIDPVGTVQWLDERTRRPLMLVYVDRPARIAGSFTRAGRTIGYDIRATAPGYVWIGSGPAGERETLFRAVPAPRGLILRINTTASSRGNQAKKES
jgi:hypothetical protein